MSTVEAPSSPPRASVYQPFALEILRVRRLTALENLYEIRPLDGRPLGHAPGQFVQVSVVGVGECPISICSSPTRGETFELCVRRVGEVTDAIHRLRGGDFVGVRGPLGHGFDVERLHGSDMLIVAGGCALAPARSLIQYILDRREHFGAFHLLYGARTPEELLFRDELDQWRRDGFVDCRVTVDRADGSWSAPVGVVTRLFESLPAIDPAKTKAVVIGPPVMFKFVMAEIVSLGIPAEQVYCSLERRMKCGIGKCGHCQVNRMYACLDGPVFTFDELKDLPEALE
jgi:NAD(P)H-flavin reductase